MEWVSVSDVSSAASSCGVSSVVPGISSESLVILREDFSRCDKGTVLVGRADGLKVVPPRNGERRVEMFDDRWLEDVCVLGSADREGSAERSTGLEVLIGVVEER